MPQFNFYMAGVGVAGDGRVGLLVAWDPKDRGPEAAESLDIGDIGLYSWVGTLPTISPAVFKMRGRSPIAIPAAQCPDTLDQSSNSDLFVRFGVKPGGSGGSLIGDGWLDVFEGSTKIYGISRPPETTTKVELSQGSMLVGLTEYSMQDRVVMEGLEDPLEGWTALLGGEVPAIELWKELMTPNETLNWNPL